MQQVVRVNDNGARSLDVYSEPTFTNAALMMFINKSRQRPICDLCLIGSSVEELSNGIGRCFHSLGLVVEVHLAELVKSHFPVFVSQFLDEGR